MFIIHVLLVTKLYPLRTGGMKSNQLSLQCNIVFLKVKLKLCAYIFNWNPVTVQYKLTFSSAHRAVKRYRADVDLKRKQCFFLILIFKKKTKQLNGYWKLFLIFHFAILYDKYLFWSQRKSSDSSRRTLFSRSNWLPRAAMEKCFHLS